MKKTMKDELLELLRRDAYRTGEFKLSSGRTSKHYINCKPVTLTGRGLSLISDIILKACLDVDTVAVGGLTLGADPLVAGVAMKGNLSGLIVRKEPKGHGTGAWIEGPVLPEGSKVVVLEDVITTGGSAIKAATRLRDAGYKVNRVVSIVDRQVNDEASEFMESVDLELITMYQLQDIVYAKDE